VDLEWIVANREQLFAEAVRDVLAGKTWHEVPQEEARAEQEARYEVDPWEDILREWLAGNKAELTTIQILRLACNKEADTVKSGDARRIAAIMRRLGWTSKKRQGGARYWVPKIVT
jgi:putative DNA primase/helicase